MPTKATARDNLGATTPAIRRRGPSLQVSGCEPLWAVLPGTTTAVSHPRIRGIYNDIGVVPRGGLAVE